MLSAHGGWISMSAQMTLDHTATVNQVTTMAITDGPIPADICNYHRNSIPAYAIEQQ
jgi:hypothetical protein